MADHSSGAESAAEWGTTVESEYSHLKYFKNYSLKTPKSENRSEWGTAVESDFFT